jgi:two-component system KDP operon response regulator KdpE
MTSVLVVDDDPQLVRALRITLTARGYTVATAANGAAALTAASRTPPELIILDLGLPDLDGVAVIEGLRGWCVAPIIVLSARHTEPAKVDALDAGADDYITKPFGMDELLARIRAALRRAAPTTASAVVVTDAFTVDLAAKRVTTPDGEIRLTPTEWHLLEALVREPGKLITQRQLLQQVWGPAYETETNYLRVHLANLRRKLEPDPSRPRYLITEPGIGYRFTDHQQTDR